MSQQDNTNVSQQQAQVPQPVASLPYQIAYIQMPAATGAAGTGGGVAMPFHIVPVLASGGSLGSLQMAQLAHLMQGQQAQAAMYQDPTRQGAVLMAQQDATAAGRQGMLAGLDLAARAALGSQLTSKTTSKTAAVSSEPNKAAGNPSSTAAVDLAAAAVACSDAATTAARASTAAGVQADSAALLAAAFQVQGPAGLHDPATAAAIAAAIPVAPRGQKHKQKQQQQQQHPQQLLLDTPASDPADLASPTALEAAAAAAASQIPAAAEAAIAAAEAAAAAAAAAAGAAGLTSPEKLPAGQLAASQQGTPQQLQQQPEQGAQAQSKQHSSSREVWEQLLLDSELDIDGQLDAEAADAGAADGTAMGADAAAGATVVREPSTRKLRLKQRRTFNLKRKFAELTAQVEGALCEARAMCAWKQSPHQPAAKQPRLGDSELRQLASGRSRRLAEVAAKQCLQVIKALITHKFAFPFNCPVDLTKYADYTHYVQHPMDFGTMKTKAEEGQYAEPAEVYKDALLVFNNARKYNQPTEDVYYMATVLQEYFQERWSKLVTPKLQEEAKLARSEEDAMRARKAAAARAAAEVAAQEAACRLASHLDELHEQLAQLRVQAALYCEPLASAARVGLAAGLEALPLKQLEAALGLVLPRIMAAAEGQQQQQYTGKAAAAGNTGKIEVEVDLARCSALELRQLQHFVAACQAAHASSTQQQAADVAAPAVGTAGDSAADDAANTVGSQSAAAGAAVEAAASDPADAAVAPADSAAAPPDATAAAAAASGARSMSGFPVVGAHEASLSERAGIVWPGQVIGAGLKARSRLLLPGQPDQPLPPPLPPLAPGAAAVAAAPGGIASGFTAVAASGATAGVAGPPGKHSNYVPSKRRSSETGTARPPLPPAARPSRLALGVAAAGHPPSSAPAAAPPATGQSVPGSPFAGPAATMVSPSANDATPPVAHDHTAARRSGQLAVASSSTDPQEQAKQQQQGQQQQQQQQGVTGDCPSMSGAQGQGLDTPAATGGALEDAHLHEQQVKHTIAVQQHLEQHQELGDVAAGTAAGQQQSKISCTGPASQQQEWLSGHQQQQRQHIRSPCGGVGSSSSDQVEHHEQEKSEQCAAANITHHGRPGSSWEEAAAAVSTAKRHVDRAAAAASGVGSDSEIEDVFEDACGGSDSEQ